MWKCLRLLILLFAFALVNMIYYPLPQAFSHGFSSEMLPPAGIGERDASLMTEINPPILTADRQEDAYFHVRLLDANSEENFEYVSYFITARKDGEVLMHDLFYSEEGPLTIRIQPSEGEVNVFGSKDPFLDAWISQTGEITIRGPLLLEGGLYQFVIEIFSIDHLRGILEEPVSFESWLSVGSVFNQQVEADGQLRDMRIVSYYDQVENLEHDTEGQELRWYMPFDWDLDRIQEATAIMVHQEILVPNEWEEFASARTFSAAVNTEQLSPQSVMVDPFTSEEHLVVHYVIAREELISLAERQQERATGDNYIDGMVFSLSPEDHQLQNITTTRFITETGGLQVETSWSPPLLEPAVESRLDIAFSDMLMENAPLVDSDVLYSIAIYDQDENIVERRQDLVAINGTDSVNFTFPAEDTYRIHIDVRAVVDEDGMTDENRGGVAIGTVVVPEFSILTTPLLAAALLAVFVLLMRSGSWRRLY